MATLIQRLRSQRPTLGAIGTTLIGGFAAQLTLAVTGVILARALGPEDRGHLALITVVWVVVVQLAALGLPFALSFSAARVPGRAIEIMRQVRKAIWIRLAVAVFLCAAALVPLTIGKPGYVQVGALVAVAVVAPGILQECGLGILQGLQRFVPYYVLGTAPNAVFAVAAGALLLGGKEGFTQLTVAWGATVAIVFPATLGKARLEAAREHDSDAPAAPSTSWILRFGRRSMLGSAPPVETYRIDQAVVAVFLAPVSLGLYVVALAFTNLPRFIAQAVGVVANPLVASSETHGQARRRMWWFAWMAIPLYLPVAVGLWILAPQLTDFFFGSEFADAVPVTRLLLIASALYCARRVLTDAARGAGYPVAGSVAEVAALIGAIPFFAIFVPASGIHGVAYALIASSSVALGALVGMLIHPGARHSMPSGWFEAAAGEEIDALPARADHAEP